MSLDKAIHDHAHQKQSPSPVSGKLPARVFGKVILWDRIIVGGAAAHGDADQRCTRVHGGAGVSGHLHGKKGLADHPCLGSVNITPKHAIARGEFIDQRECVCVW